MGSVVAIDIGGTTIKSAVALRPRSLAETTLTDVQRRRTPVGDARALIDAIVDIVHGHDREPEAVGIVMPGLLDVANGRVRVAGNLRLIDTPIVAPVRAALGVPIAFDHDVRAGALAELHSGAARGLRNAAVMPIGTGIAVAFIIDGEVRSADGFMGEIGHAWVGADEQCVCGLTGCLEAVSSAAAIARRYEHASGTAASAEKVIALAATGDVVAARVWQDAIDGLVRASATITSLLGPEAIVIGGGLSRAGDALLEPLRAGLSTHVSYQRIPEIRAAAHGDDAGCLGAAMAAFRSGGLA